VKFVLVATYIVPLVFMVCMSLILFGIDLVELDFDTHYHML